MLCLALLALSLPAPIYGILPDIPDINFIIENHLDQGQTTLNEVIITEGEQMMEDTQHQLEDAVHQMDNESARSRSPPLDPHHHNESSAADNQPMILHMSTIEMIDKERDNRTTTPSNSMENSISHDCIIDEDCEKGRYCLYETRQSRCLPCKEKDVPCTKDEECCGEQLCVWGQCSANATKGEPGSLCQHQKDCSTDLCCAFHKALLFPVCSPKPIERERCYGRSNHLMELLSWDMEGEGPKEHCPCTGDLQCQPHGRGSMCLKGQKSSEEELTDTLYSQIDYIV